jgi:hypothetical protein
MLEFLGLALLATVLGGKVYHWRLGLERSCQYLCEFDVGDSWLSTIGHCAWRHFISFSNGEKETKQRKRLQTPAPSERPRTPLPVVRK